jgi:hypothetical protein
VFVCFASVRGARSLKLPKLPWLLHAEVDELWFEYYSEAKLSFIHLLHSIGNARVESYLHGHSCLSNVSMSCLIIGVLSLLQPWPPPTELQVSVSFAKCRPMSCWDIDASTMAVSCYTAQWILIYMLLC